MRLQLPLLPASKQLVDIAFRKARKSAVRMRRQKNRLKNAKSQGIKKIEASCNYFTGRLQQAVKGFPSMQKLHPFYRELIGATVELDAMLRALAQMNAACRIAVRLKRQYIGKAKALQRGEEKRAGIIVKEFYGRLSSLAKSLDKAIEAYNQNARAMRELPAVQFDLPSVIIAGCPNTGKSTILGRLTKSRPKVAAYPFTTQHLQIGHLIHNQKPWLRLQLIDTPGLLDRSLEKRNKAERKAIAALRHLADAIVFVVDPTMRCGFALSEQISLLNDIKREFKGSKIFVALNKADAASEAELDAAKKAVGGKVLLEGHGMESLLGQQLQCLL